MLEICIIDHHCHEACVMFIVKRGLFDSIEDFDYFYYMQF